MMGQNHKSAALFGLLYGYVTYSIFIAIYNYCGPGIDKQGYSIMLPPELMVVPFLFMLYGWISGFNLSKKGVLWIIGVWLGVAGALYLAHRRTAVTILWGGSKTELVREALEATMGQLISGKLFVDVYLPIVVGLMLGVLSKLLVGCFRRYLRSYGKEASQ